MFDHFSFIAPIYARVTYSKRELLSQIAGLPVAGRLLDVGGGTGRVAAAIRDLVDEIIIADISLGMLRNSHASLALRSVCGLSEALPFPTASFERALMVDALHHVIHQQNSMNEMFRVLKPGGLLIIEEPDIRATGVKWIALAEKLLLMRSHFLTPQKIETMLAAGEKKIHAQDGTAWIIFKK